MMTEVEFESENNVPYSMSVTLGDDDSGIDWALNNGEHVKTLLDEKGALLIRGMKLNGSKQFSRFLNIVLGSELMNYNYRSTPRTELRGRVYTASEYPPSETIPLHNENSYSNFWPRKIGFLCLIPAEAGGETPICDSRLIYKMLPVWLREKFEEKGVLYVRNYSYLDLPWQEVFNTNDKGEVEEYCLRNNLQYEWTEDDNLRTRQLNSAAMVHPETKEKVWFNQAHLFHVSSLGADRQDALIKSVGEENLPRNTYYGDGSAIEPAVLEIIRNTYLDAKIIFKWETQSVMLLDNLLFAHGREPYTGARNVLVGMA